MPPAVRPAWATRWAATLDAIHSWCHDAGVTPIAACLAFALARPEVDRVIVGLDHPGQLAGIVAALAEHVPVIPDTWKVDDPDLIDPSRWPQPLVEQRSS
jgi:aryl-alcohol dehydrogenase-like predicted oxidoreductase